MRRLIVFFCLLLLLVAFGGRRPTRLETLPSVMLWAWERPEDLSFIDPHTTGVAYLAKTIDIRGDMMTVRPRLQPLRLPPGTRIAAVVRIESDGKGMASASPSQVKRVAEQVLSLANGAAVVQIDFDALSSERKFYRELVKEVRRQLPADIGLSITALASWCAGDDWLGDLPVDEAVPMLFRLGVDQRPFQRRLETGQPFESRMCQSAAGVSTDEPVTRPAADRLYIFNPKPWTRDSFIAAMETYRK